MENRPNAQHADERTMSLVQLALSRPEDERESCLRQACGTDGELFERAWDYIKREREMQGFLLDPLRVVAEEDAFVPGQLLINRFLIVRRVAQGGMGIIWEANDQKLDRHVAIKCAKAGYGKHLPPEVRHAREVSHPNLCKIFEIHTASTPHGEIDFISMEFLQGETLAERLRAGPLPERKARVIAEQLCAGLAEAHRNGLIHGDLKPSNVLLAANREGGIRAVITDFGLARMAESTARTMGGTPAYMAPELWTEKKPSTATDIYALGVMLWELHAGLPGSQLGIASSTLPLGAYIVRQPPRGRRRWERIIARCLHPDPTQRFQDAAAVVEALQPSRKLRRIRIGAVTALLAVASAFATRMWMTAPKETVRLALLPDGEDNLLLKATGDELGRLKGNSQTTFKFISSNALASRGIVTGSGAHAELGATHVLLVGADRQDDAILVHAGLVDQNTGVEIRNWKVPYEPAELHHAPVAIAALVTETLHLQPPPENSTVSPLARQDYQDGVAALRRDHTVDQALKSFEKAVASDPDSALTWAGLAEAQRLHNYVSGEKEWLDRAVASMKKAQKRNGDLPEVHRIAGLLDALSGSYDEATPHYRRAIELAPQNDDAYRRLGETFRNSNKWPEALQTFRKAADLNPLQYRNWRDLGSLYFLKGRYEEAISCFQKATELAPDEPKVRSDLGASLLSVGNFKQAEQEFEKSLAASESADTFDYLGLVLMYQARNRDALPYFWRSIKMRPDYLYFAHLGAAYRQIGHRVESKHAFEKGLLSAESQLALNPRDNFARSYLAYLCACLGDRDRALSELSQVPHGVGSDAEEKWMTALTYESLGLRENTLASLHSTPRTVLAELYRWPEVTDLHHDSRFIKLLADAANLQEKR